MSEVATAPSPTPAPTSAQPSPSAASPSSLDPNYSTFSATEVKTDVPTTAAVSYTHLTLPTIYSV